MTQITEDEFRAYEDVRESGVTNMWNVKLVCELTGLDDGKVMAIMKGYSELKEAYLQ